MAEAHLEVQIGITKFVAEGSTAWVDAKYESFLAQLAGTGEFSSHHNMPLQNKNSITDEEGTKIPLAVFLKEASVGANQNKRFLATAIWLKHQGQKIIQTAAIAKELAEAQQQRLGNPADILNQNVRKGFCVKTSDGFYVTPEGEASLWQS